jgi:hypothetical protein
MVGGVGVEGLRLEYEVQLRLGRVREVYVWG